HRAGESQGARTARRRRQDDPRARHLRRAGRVPAPAALGEAPAVQLAAVELCRPTSQRRRASAATATADAQVRVLTTPGRADARAGVAPPVSLALARGADAKLSRIDLEDVTVSYRIDPREETLTLVDVEGGAGDQPGAQAG